MLRTSSAAVNWSEEAVILLQTKQPAYCSCYPASKQRVVAASVCCTQLYFPGTSNRAFLFSPSDSDWQDEDALITHIPLSDILSS